MADTYPTRVTVEQRKQAALARLDAVSQRIRARRAQSPVARQTTARWTGNGLHIGWYGAAPGARPSARWTGTHLEFEGVSATKRWPLPRKPSLEQALLLINRWQECLE